MMRDIPRPLFTVAFILILRLTTSCVHCNDYDQLENNNLLKLLLLNKQESDLSPLSDIPNVIRNRRSASETKIKNKNSVHSFLSDSDNRLRFRSYLLRSRKFMDIKKIEFWERSNTILHMIAEPDFQRTDKLLPKNRIHEVFYLKIKNLIGYAEQHIIAFNLVELENMKKILRGITIPSILMMIRNSQTIVEQALYLTYQEYRYIDSLKSFGLNYMEPENSTKYHTSATNPKETYPTDSTTKYPTKKYTTANPTEIYTTADYYWTEKYSTEKYPRERYPTERHEKEKFPTERYFSRQYPTERYLRGDPSFEKPLYDTAQDILHMAEKIKQESLKLTEDTLKTISEQMKQMGENMSKSFQEIADSMKIMFYPEW